MEAPRRPSPGSGPTPPTTPESRRSAPRLPEPPAFRSHPEGAPLACASCASPILSKSAPPMCWGCGRPMCADCYWHHGLTPTAHRCTSCLAHSPSDSLGISGGHSVRPAGVTSAP